MPLRLTHKPDLHLSNILRGGGRITGVVDWDELGLGSRALDLVALAFDCVRIGDQLAADRLFARAISVAGHDGLRCLVSYRAIALISSHWLEGSQDEVDAAVTVISAIVGKLRIMPRD